MVFGTYQRMRVKGASWAGTSHKKLHLLGNILKMLARLVFLVYPLHDVYRTCCGGCCQDLKLSAEENLRLLKFCDAQ